MRAANICALVALVWLAAGTGAGLWAQAELFAPGVRGDIAGKKAMFEMAILLHGIFLHICLPLVASFALGLALLGQHRGWGVLSLLSLLVVILSAAIPIVAYRTVTGFTVGIEVGEGLPVGLIVASVAGLACALLSGPDFQIGVVFAGLCGGILLTVAAVLQAVIANAGGGAVLHDTYFMLAQDHAAGLSLAFCAFAVLLVWAGRDRPVRLAWLVAPILAIALVSGLALVLAEARLGLAGMPRRYIDYAQEFFPLHRFASWAGFLLAFSFAAGAAFLVYLKFGVRSPVPHAFD